MKQLIAGNWKMNLNTEQSVRLIRELKVPDHSADVVVCPSFPYLASVKHLLIGSQIKLGAQDCHSETSGAYTGDVSAVMLKDIGCDYVIIGHSERRHGHDESNAIVCCKTAAAIGQGLKVILCIGETDEQNKAGITNEILSSQLVESIPQGATSQNIIIAYEPVWAIGTGRTASNEEIIKTHAFIRQELATICIHSEQMPILYGGSVNAKNAQEILSLPEVNGVLVGGASLKADDFNQIISAALCE